MPSPAIARKKYVQSHCWKEQAKITDCRHSLFCFIKTAHIGAGSSGGGVEDGTSPSEKF